MAARNLTAGLVQALEYNAEGPSRQVLWDQKVVGLGVRIMPTGKKSYVIAYRLEGRPCIYHLGRVENYLNVSDARQEASELLRRVRREKFDPVAERRRERSAETISQLFEQWLKAIKKSRSPRTHRDYRIYVEGYLTPEIGSRRPTNLARPDVRRLHAMLTVKHGPVTANRVIQALRACYGWALKQDSETLPAGFPNPVVGVEFNRELVRREFVRPAELECLTREMLAENDPWVRSYLLLLVLTGARGGELLKLRWSDVSLEASELVLRATKNHSDFLLKLSRAAVDILRTIPRTSSDLVFTPRRRDGGQHMARPRKAWENVLKRAGINRNVTLHDLRRTAGVLLGSQGFTAEQIARQLNHKSNVTAKVYVQVADDLQQRMADALGGTATAILTAAGASITPTSEPPPTSTPPDTTSRRRMDADELRVPGARADATEAATRPSRENRFELQGTA